MPTVVQLKAIGGATVSNQIKFADETFENN
jgi:hypothetical protein